MIHKIGDIRRLKEIEQVARKLPPKKEMTPEQQQLANRLAVEALQILGRLNTNRVY